MFTISRLLRNGDDGGVGVSANDSGHHRCIGDPQTFDAENPKIRIDDAADGASAGPALYFRKMARKKSLPAPSETAERLGRHRCAKAESSILSATIELLESKPLRDVTAEAIAKKAGVSKATIYKWWPNKSLVALDAFLSNAKPC